MKPWIELYDAHRSLRARGREAETDLRRALKWIGEREPSVFDAHVQQRFQPDNNSNNNVRTVVLGADKQGEYVATWNLSASDQAEVHLEEAHLTVVLVSDKSTGHLHEMALMVEGTKADGQPWTIAIHLPDDRVTQKVPDGDRQGHGACGHAALHCHVGPTLDASPKVRVPLPPLRPGDLLAWLMSQVIPTLDFEPAPWSDVVAQLAAKGV